VTTVTTVAEAEPLRPPPPYPARRRSVRPRATSGCGAPGVPAPYQERV